MDAKILANMKEVLAKTRKDKKSRSRKPLKTKEPVNDESISEILSKNWKFSSPTDQVSPENGDSTPPIKVNAFEKLMNKRSESSGGEPVAQSGKKRKYLRKTKLSKIIDDSDSQPLIDENKSKPESPTSGILKFFEQPKTSPVVSEHSSKKRGLVLEDATDLAGRTKKVKLFLDSNENSIEQEAEAVVELPSQRPRRSCAANVDYKLLISPERATSETKKSRRAHLNDEDYCEILDVDDDNESKPAKKLAPLFMKKVPRPAVDPEVEEARRSFLLSGLPDEIRSSINKQKQYEDEILSNELVSFPLTSHVTQLKHDDEDHHDLMSSRVKVRSEEDAEVEAPSKKLEIGMLTGSQSFDTLAQEISPIIPVVRAKPRSDDLKARVKELKEVFGNFPTNRCFKQLFWMYQNSGCNDAVSNGSENSARAEENSMFVNIFKPTGIKHFVVNVEPMKELQKFLLTWNDKTESGDSDDSNSRSTTKGSNFVVLSGPNGSGKTVSVYALAEELNYQVIETNAATRRSGKKLLESLLEATQSHRVKDKTVKLYSNDNEASSSEDMCDVAGAKSIILIEDAELAFDSDDGFVSSIQQLINISKRPVILTTNDRDCQHLQKFIQSNEIEFGIGSNSDESDNYSKYLTLLSLAIGCELETHAIDQLLSSNKHDMRKTLNEIEFYVRGENTKSSRRKDLMEIFKRTESPADLSKPRVTSESLDEIAFKASLASSFTSFSVNEYKDTSYQQHELTQEICDYLAKSDFSYEEKCSAAGKFKRSTSTVVFPLSSSLHLSKAQSTDYLPAFRSICRSERLRGESGRRQTNINRGHYLRFLVQQNTFGTNYLNEQCEILQ